MANVLMVTLGGIAVATESLEGAQRPPYTAVDTAHGDREFQLLWPEGAPGALAAEPVDRPKITIYRAPAATANRAAVIVCPGGGYRIVAADHEGRQVAEWLNTLGVSAFVLQYRLGPRYRHPVPLQDAQRALRLVRARAKEFGIDKARLGILGFSAGGHLASTAGTHFDAGRTGDPDPVERESSRPDFLVLGYPVMSFDAPFTHRGSAELLLGAQPDPKVLQLLSNERQVTSQTPPTFLVHTDEDTGVPPENSLVFYQALRKAKVPAELHIFAKGGHGLGLGGASDRGFSDWPRLCAAWMENMGFLKHTSPPMP